MQAIGENAGFGTDRRFPHDPVFRRFPGPERLLRML